MHASAPHCFAVINLGTLVIIAACLLQGYTHGARAAALAPVAVGPLHSLRFLPLLSAHPPATLPCLRMQGKIYNAVHAKQGQLV